MSALTNMQLSNRRKQENTQRHNFHQRCCLNWQQEAGAKGHVITQEVSEIDRDGLASSAFSSIVQVTPL